MCEACEFKVLWAGVPVVDDANFDLEAKKGFS